MGLLRGQSPQRQQLDALLLVVESNAAQLAGVVAKELRPGDRGTVVIQLRYLADQIDTYGPAN